MNATTYARAFYQDTAPRRRSLTNMRRGVKRNCQWLLDQLRADGFLRTSYSVDEALTLARQTHSHVDVMSPHGHQHNTEHGGNRRRDSLSLRTLGTKRTLRAFERAVFTLDFVQYHVAPLHAEQLP